MIAVDTNILVYAHREDAPQHRPAKEALLRLATGVAPFGIPWPSVSEFLAIVTHQRIYQPPSTTAQALAGVNALKALPNARFLGETQRHLDVLEMILSPGVTGAKMHDARIAAICLSHGVSELWTADRDFSYFPELRTRNPLIA
ncbi:MAG: PIN domain-containing protein [Propionibacteriaceae bacterium]|nr:PIN domain-containing protein [Propionibacteriaceae bacterium]